MKKVVVELKVNGTAHQLLVEPRATLLECLRAELGLTGAKEGCGLGACGTCTVLLDGRPVRSCLTLAVEAEGHDVLTIEGLAETGTAGQPGALHPVQEAFVENHAIQRGFCTPGMILTAKALLDEDAQPSEADVRHALSGQACRCTGYTKIVESVLAAAGKMEAK
ncbi:MAG: (2Fe-2S)-binding protein [Deltaproteobacteria bacterium]|nr:(2Fe-2S)-binding protein [Deltaproteobacteria bacterium]